jgi:hypothetical protein
MLHESLVAGFSGASALGGASFGPLDFLFQPWTFRVGGENVFSKEIWSNFMDFFRIGLALVTAGLLLVEARARRLGERLSARATKRIAVGLTVLGFLAYYDFFNPNVRYVNYYHRHELFHYYLGSKYFEEVGYTRLYECAAIAEVDLGRGAALKKREIRDLRVNLIKPMTETNVFLAPEECKKRFTPERWEAFKSDVAWLEKSARGSYWENMVKDHGYNPPPVWTMQGKFFSSFGVAGDGFFKALATLDVALQLGALLLIGWAFGYRIMAIAAVFWGCNAPANFYWTGGAFLRQDWIFLFVASVCLARKRYFGLAGAALTWSSLLRVFPLIAFAGWAVMIAIHLIRHRKLHPDHARLIGGCVVAVGILLPASLVVAGGPAAYEEFIAHISVHKNTPLTNHMGLETMVSHDWEGRMRFSRNDTLDDPFAQWKSGRLERYHDAKPLVWAIRLSVIGWLIWALRRTKLLWVGVPLSVPLIVCFTNLTCYYYSMFMVGAALVRARPFLGPAFLAASGASHVILRTFYFIDDKYNAMSYLFFALGLLFLAAYSRPFSMDRLRAWLDGRPEPKSGRAPPAVGRDPVATAAE